MAGADALPLPCRLRDRYELRRVLARNGTTAYAAFDHALRRDVVVHVVADRTAPGAAAGDLAHVARALARLEHPGVAACHDLGEDAAVGAWLATSAVSGRSLDQILNDGAGGLMPAIHLVLRVAEVMAHAHQRGVTHGRLQAQGVLVADGGQVIVEGWGKGLVADAGAPPADAAAADVRALGRLIDACLDTVADAPRSRARAEVAAIAAAAADGRYADARALATDLRALIAGHVVRAHATGPWAEIRKWVRRHPLLATSILLLLATVLATAIAFSAVRANAIARMTAANASLSLAEAEARVATEIAERATTAALGLGDRATLRRLLAAADSLWPAVTQDLAQYDRWLAEAEQLAGKLGDHRARLQAVSEADTLAAGAGAPAAALLDARAWLRDVLGELVRDLEHLASEERGELAAVRRRREQAATIVARSTTGSAAAAAWAEAMAGIAAAPAYRGWRGPPLSPQLGLLPIGQDRHSGLFEFAHLATGEPAARDPDTGRLQLRPDCGVVLVLLPGGVLAMGAQAQDPNGASYSADAGRDEGPVHDVALAPFFCSKYELTRAQWARLAGGTVPQDGLLPAVKIAWEDCMRILPRAGLRVPTEAQWELAARGATRTPWWTGADFQSLQGAENIRDQSHHADGAPWNDGFIYGAPVDSMRANPFGLHHVLGNVAEFCRDSASPYFMPVRGADAERLPGTSDLRTGRGGNWTSQPWDVRAAARKSPPPTHAKDDWGVRPVRGLDPR